MGQPEKLGDILDRGMRCSPKRLPTDLENNLADARGCILLATQNIPDPSFVQQYDERLTGAARAYLASAYELIESAERALGISPLSPGKIIP